MALTPKLMLSPVTLFLSLAISTVGLPLVQAADQQEYLSTIGAKLSDPTSDVWALLTEFDVSYSEGDLSGGDHRSGSSTTFKPIMPVGFGVARTIRIGKMPVKFQLSAEKSIVRQDDFGTDWKIRFNIIPVIPSLVKRPLFD